MVLLGLLACGVMATDPCLDRPALQARIEAKVTAYSALTASLRDEKHRRFRPVRLALDPVQPDSLGDLLQVDSRGSVFFRSQTAQLGGRDWASLLASIKQSKRTGQPLLVGIDHQTKTAMVRGLFAALWQQGVKDIDLIFTTNDRSVEDPGTPHPSIETFVRSERAMGRWSPVVGGPSTWEQCKGIEPFQVVQQRPLVTRAKLLSKLVLEEYIACGCKPSADEVVWEFRSQMPPAFHGVLRARLAKDGARIEGEQWVHAVDQLDLSQFGATGTERVRLIAGVGE